MIIKTQAKNGVITQAVKTYDELTAEEKKKLVFVSGTKKEFYENYIVNYNKKGDLLRVQCHESTSERTKEVNIKSAEIKATPNIGDFLDATYGHGETQEKARKKIAASAIKELLIENDSSIAEVSRTSDVSATTIYSAADKPVAKTSVAVIKAIATTINKTPGDVLNELIKLEKDMG